MTECGFPRRSGDGADCAVSSRAAKCVCAVIRWVFRCSVSKQTLPRWRNETENQLVYRTHEAADDAELKTKLCHVSAAGSSTCCSQHSTQPRRTAGQKPSEVRRTVVPSPVCCGGDLGMWCYILPFFLYHSNSQCTVLTRHTHTHTHSCLLLLTFEMFL